MRFLIQKYYQEDSAIVRFNVGEEEEESNNIE